MLAIVEGIKKEIRIIELIVLNETRKNNDIRLAEIRLSLLEYEYVIENGIVKSLPNFEVQAKIIFYQT